MPLYIHLVHPPGYLGLYICVGKGGGGGAGIWEFMSFRKVETMWPSDGMLWLGEDCLYDGRLADVN